MKGDYCYEKRRIAGGGDQLEDIKTTAPGSDEYKRKTDDMVKMMDRHIELKKIEKEAKAKEEELEIDKQDKMVRNGIALLSFVGGALITVWGTKKSFKFEEVGLKPDVNS